MQGKIIKAISGFYYVRVSANEQQEDMGLFECKAKGIFRKEAKKPLVGDRVEFDVLDENTKKGNIIKVFPRRNQLIRPAVANVDQALVFFALKFPNPNFNLLDRFLIMMERLNLPILLCFNKEDLVTEEEKKRIREIYEPCNYQMFFCSAKNEEHLEEIKEALLGKTSALAGPSGAGKSTFVNTLQEHHVQETGDISKKIKRGKNTTRHTNLIEINQDSYIIDTPGFSSLEVEEIEKEELTTYYPEFVRHEAACKFAGCSHIKEPICGIKDAVSEGKISEVRYQNYLLLYNEIKEKEKILMKTVAPSILSANFWELGKDIECVTNAGAEWLHVDVMDGIFVPSISFGMPVLKNIRSHTEAFLDVHLMIDRPERYIEDFVNAGADSITVHYESTKALMESLLMIRKFGKKVGISINPETPIEVIRPYLEYVDLVLLMSVHPGFGGQKYIASSTNRIKRLKKMIEEIDKPIHLEVDGGINLENLEMVSDAGADVIVAGSAIFGNDAAKVTKEMISILNNKE